ncbi:MAG TPA: elongation factor P, partial [Elusimicrobia bacterium]|nr:elongation factor P [Elusimicrobiota bacterium]
MITTADFRNGLNIEFEGQPYRIVWFQHHKPGKGGAVMRTKLKNLHTGAIIEQTFKSGEKFT